METSAFGCSEYEDVGLSLTSFLQLPLLQIISSDKVYGPGSDDAVLQCSRKYAWFGMSVGMLAVTVVFVALGFLVRIDGPKMRAGEAHLASAATPKSEGSTRPAHLEAIDGLRAVFAVWVLIRHLRGLKFIAMPYTIWVLPINECALMQFFFVASGFVNTRALGRQSQSARDFSFDLKKSLLFIQRRMARLFPMLWFSAVLMASVMTAGYQGDLSGRGCLGGVWFEEVTGVKSFEATFRDEMGVNFPTWFVSTLLILSVCFPVLYNICPSRPEATATLLLFVIVARSCPLIFPALAQYHHFVSYTSPFIRFPEFFAGVLSAIWCRSIPSYAASWSGWGCVFDASVVLAVFGAWYEPLPPVPVADFRLTGVFCITCIAASAALDAKGFPTPGYWPQLGLLGSVLACGPLQFLARYSWTIYVLQLPCFMICKVALPDVLMNYWAAVPLTVLFGIFADVALDQPTQRALDRYIRDAAT
jgi:peptidoglycan/LPS O-acetylase OafA/YrhL